MAHSKTNPDLVKLRQKMKTELERTATIEEVAVSATKSLDSLENGTDHLPSMIRFLIDLSFYLSSNNPELKGTKPMYQIDKLLTKLAQLLVDLDGGADSPLISNKKKTGRPRSSIADIQYIYRIVAVSRLTDRIWKIERTTVRQRQEKLASLVRAKGAADFTWRHIRSANANLAKLYHAGIDAEVNLFNEQLILEDADEETVFAALDGDLEFIARAFRRKNQKP